MSYASVYSKNNNRWNFNLENEYWVGGLYKAPNLSSGFHGILKQWWEYYCSNTDKIVLLVAENIDVKKQLQELYPNWIIHICDYYPELQSGNNIDIVGDICEFGSIPENTYDLIVSQANLEHIYDPYGAMINIFNGLKKGGFVISHTHPPGMGYHAFPHDCIRFMKDWWYLVEKHSKIPVELMELYQTHNDANVFSCYRKK